LGGPPSAHAAEREISFTLGTEREAARTLGRLIVVPTADTIDLATEIRIRSRNDRSRNLRCHI
jgi:hypothetical protein